VQVVSGGVEVNGTALAAGDGAAIESEPEIGIRAFDAAEFLLFDLP
jgi:redox-sensitive bicupin YhaK (pirin superfamily)